MAVLVLAGNVRRLVYLYHYPGSMEGRCRQIGLEVFSEAHTLTIGTLTEERATGVLEVTEGSEVLTIIKTQNARRSACSRS